MVEKGKSMMSREERSHMRHRAHTRSSLAGGKARGRRTSGGQNESSPRILPKPDAYQCTFNMIQTVENDPLNLLSSN